MTTKFIGMKEFRQHIAHYTHEAQTREIEFVVLKKNIPVLHVRRINEKEFALETLSKTIKKARTQARRGAVYPQEQLLKELGLK